jgi:hypothetical protein
VPDEKEVQILRGVLTAIQRGIGAREVEDA